MVVLPTAKDGQPAVLQYYQKESKRKKKKRGKPLKIRQTIPIGLIKRVSLTLEPAHRIEDSKGGTLRIQLLKPSELNNYNNLHHNQDQDQNQNPNHNGSDNGKTKRAVKSLKIHRQPRELTICCPNNSSLYLWQTVLCERRMQIDRRLARQHAARDVDLNRASQFFTLCEEYKNMVCGGSTPFRRRKRTGGLLLKLHALHQDFVNVATTAAQELVESIVVGECSFASVGKAEYQVNRSSWRFKARVTAWTNSGFGVARTGTAKWKLEGHVSVR